MQRASFRPRREPGSFVSTSVGPVFVARRRSPRSTQRPLVMIHGWLMAHGYFAPLVDGLRADRDLVLVDLPGHGESACPSPTDFGYDVRAFARVVAEVCDALDLGAVDVLGHSLGGGVALELAQQQPKRVARLVLVSALAYRMPLPVEAKLLLVPKLGALLWRAFARRRDFERQMRRDFEDPSVIGDAYIDWAYDAFNREGARSAAYAAFVAATSLPADDARPRQVRQPTLIVWGEADRLLPLSHGRRLAAALPDALLEIIPATAHTPFLERTALVVSAIGRWLA